MKIGQLIDELSKSAQIFALGSSGFEYAMARYWQEKGMIARPKPFPPAGPVDQLIVVSGSAATNTAEQIKYSLAQGFKGIALNTDLLVDDASVENERNRVITLALEYLGENRSILIYTTIGPNDPVIDRTKKRVRELGIDQSETGKLIGRQQGLILRALLTATSIRRVCVAGGDTCSYTLRQLDIHSLELLMPITPAAPLCLASSDTPIFDGLQVASKGGQIGAPDYFMRVLEGK
jgi:uncharacterized protein YgbK (DUF1537 family)